MSKTQSSPLEYACPHVFTPAELHRDPMYQACGAQAGEPCLWARRWDGFSDPAFHSERLEAANNAPGTHPLDPELFREAVLSTGLV